MAKNMSVLFLVTLLSAAIAKITLQEAPKIEEQDDVVPEQSASPRRLDKRLEIANFKDRKTERSKELNNRANTTNTPSTLGTSTAVYRWKADSGGTCILLVVDALVGFTYVTKLDEVLEVDSFVPASATVKGDCKDEDKETLILKWKSFVLMMYFSKTPGGERWFVSKMELKFDSADQFFAHIKNPGRTYILSTDPNQGQLLFPTPVGKSYVCDREIEVKLSSPDTDTTATVFLRKLQLEPFIFKNDEFGPEYKCSSTGAGTYRSETAPLIVGSMLASACLLTIVGYAVYRYFNIEKVSYDTME
ncbi:lysosome-associated membrane glycoprotein 5 [Rhodnius prolixus]|uniref:Lysosome-associated membrane glycoprotein 2-like luminal domain-containing protein n=2 Tax=Rhodnius TaxID=13248 RepID=T1HPU4_RHOPR